MSQRRRQQARGKPAPTTPPQARDSRTRVRVKEPGDLLALVPYLLGFHPHDSVVAVLIRSGQVVLTARVDLPPADHLSALVDEVRRLAALHQAEELVLIAYGDANPEGRSLLASLVAGLSEVGVSEAIFVDGERWWSLLCAGECCPSQGRQYEVESHRLAAEAVYAGMTVRSGRGALEALVSGPAQTEVERLERLAASVLVDLSPLTGAQTVQLLEDIVGSAVDGAVLEERQLLQLALVATDLYLRDLAWALITRADAQQHVQLWAGVVAVAPPTLASAPLALLGMAGWISGDGALQNCCVERLERLDPGYSLGVLLGDISARALSPTVWDELQADLRAELGSLAG